MLKVDLAKIKYQPGAKAGLDLAVMLCARDYNYSDIEFAAPVIFEGQASNDKGNIVVEGLLKAQIIQGCHRCGEQQNIDIAADFKEIYSHLEAKPDLEGEQDIHQFSGDSLDFSEQALAALFMELPMKTLCSANCKGICPLCGINLNQAQCTCKEQEIDPRWQKLQDLINESK